MGQPNHAASVIMTQNQYHLNEKTIGTGGWNSKKNYQRTCLKNIRPLNYVFGVMQNLFSVYSITKYFCKFSKFTADKQSSIYWQIFMVCNELLWSLKCTFVIFCYAMSWVLFWKKQLYISASSTHKNLSGELVNSPNYNYLIKGNNKQYRPNNMLIFLKFYNTLIVMNLIIINFT